MTIDNAPGAAARVEQPLTARQELLGQPGELVELSFIEEAAARSP